MKLREHHLRRDSSSLPPCMLLRLLHATFSPALLIFCFHLCISNFNELSELFLCQLAKSVAQWRICGRHLDAWAVYTRLVLLWEVFGSRIASVGKRRLWMLPWPITGSLEASHRCCMSQSGVRAGSCIGRRSGSFPICYSAST